MPAKNQEYTWTKELDKLIIGLYNKGNMPKDISIYLQEQKKISRSEQSIRTRLWRLRKKGELKGYTSKEAKKIAHSLPQLPEDEKKIHSWLKQKPLSVGELSRRLDRSKESIIRLIDSLKGKGYDVNLDKASKEVNLARDYVTKFSPLAIKIYQNHIKVGAVSDTHLTSICQQTTLLHTAYREMEKEGVDFAIHAGDVVAGINMYRGQEHERFLHGADEMKDYAIANYPMAKFKTYIIAGNHDTSFKKAAGYNIVRAICEKRKDLIYRGEESATINIKKLTIEILHPSGGQAYAISYKPQKIIEGMVGEMIQIIREKQEVDVLPNILFFGHYHVASHLPSYFGVEGYGVPCFESQTIYLKKKGLSPKIGYLITDIWYDSKGNVQRVKPDFRYMGHLQKEKDY